MLALTWLDTALEFVVSDRIRSRIARHSGDSPTVIRQTAHKPVRLNWIEKPRLCPSGSNARADGSGRDLPPCLVKKRELAAGLIEPPAQPSQLHKRRAKMPPTLLSALAKRGIVAGFYAAFRHGSSPSRDLMHNGVSCSLTRIVPLD